MEVVDTAGMPWGPSVVPHRHGRMAHKRIFNGEEGSADNFALVLADESSEYVSPRHRHPWDQIRLCLEGAVPIGRTSTVEAGEVAYFPEGVAYGPQEGGVDRLVLLLQFGGASGKGYLSLEQTNAAREELESVGSFEGGIFHRAEPRTGQRANQDAYEAIWEHVTGEPLQYAEPCYREPVVVRPEAFPWEPVAGVVGVDRRALGVFPPRRVGLDVVRIAASHGFALLAAAERRLGFVLCGDGNLDGVDFRGQATLLLEPGQGARMSAATDTELLVISVPLLEAVRERE